MSQQLDDEQHNMEVGMGLDHEQHNMEVGKGLDHLSYTGHFDHHRENI